MLHQDLLVLFYLRNDKEDEKGHLVYFFIPNCERDSETLGPTPLSSSTGWLIILPSGMDHYYSFSLMIMASTSINESKGNLAT